MALKNLSIILALILLLEVFMTSSSHSENSPVSATSVRKPSVAGAFYPADAALLDSTVTSLLDSGEKADYKVSVPDAASLGPRVLILPHAGYVYSGATAGKVYSLLRGQRHFSRIILMGCHHRMRARGATICQEDYQTPLGRVPVDQKTIADLLKSPLFASAQEQDHSLEVQLPFLQKVLKKDFSIIPVLLGYVTAQDTTALAQALAPLLKDPDTLMIISSDFTHYGPRFGYVPFQADPENIRRLDMGAVDKILALDPDGLRDYCTTTGATICGHTAIETALRCLDRKKVEARLVDYSTSGEVTGSYRESVSYAGLMISALPESGSQGR